MEEPAGQAKGRARERQREEKGKTEWEKSRGFAAFLRVFAESWIQGMRFLL
jgi:hypothetical protein